MDYVETKDELIDQFRRDPDPLYKAIHQKIVPYLNSHDYTKLIKQALLNFRRPDFKLSDLDPTVKR